MEYGSLINLITDGTAPEKVEVGMGATILSWSDRHAGTVTEIVHITTGTNKGKIRYITVQRDTADVVSGSQHDGSAKYEYKRDKNGATYRFKPTDKGWKAFSGTHPGVRLGVRDEHYDPTF